MAIDQRVKERIAASARELADEFGKVDDSNALSWLDAVPQRARCSAVNHNTVGAGGIGRAAQWWARRRAMEHNSVGVEIEPVH